MGFRRPPRQTNPGGLGVVMESPGLPNLKRPAMSKEVEREDVIVMDKAAKSYKMQEELVLKDLKQLKAEAMLDSATWEKMYAAFREKSE